MITKQISSLNNPLIKQVLLLQDKSRERKKKNLFVIEGLREVELAIKGGYSLKTIFSNNELLSKEDLKTLHLDSIDCIEVSKDVYQKIAYRNTTEGIIALAEMKSHHIEALHLSTKTPLILIAESPEKPGNIGALLRTADAAKLDAVIIANPKTDLYNPNAIRSSVGCVFTNQIAIGTNEDIITYLKKNNIAIYSAILQDAVDYHNVNYKDASALVVGPEASGLSEIWRKASSKNVKIPMQGDIDSMNVSVAAGILIYEAKRQRNFK